MDLTKDKIMNLDKTHLQMKCLMMSQLLMKVH